MGSILGSFLEPLWHRFLDLVLGGLLAHFVVIFGFVLGPSGPLKSTKNVERSLDFAFLRFSLRHVFASSFRMRFGGILCKKNEAKMEPKTTTKTIQKLKAILETILASKKPTHAQPGGMRGASRGDVRGDPYRASCSSPRSDVRFHTPLSPTRGRADSIASRIPPGLGAWCGRRLDELLS